MAITIKDVSKIAGVSTATVSHVINETRFVSEETKLKVSQAMENLNYHPSSIARSLRSQCTKTIGVLIPSIKSFFYTGVTDGIEATLMKNGYNIILSSSHEKLAFEQKALANFRSLRVDGLIMCPVAGEHSYLNNELKTFPPVVFIDRKPEGYQGDCIVIDHIQSTYDVINLLIKKGHKKIGMITGFKNISTTLDRITGYKMAYEENNLPFNKAFIKSGSFQSDAAYAETKELYEKEKVSALFFADDPMVIGALKYFKEKNINIPDQVSIISCNDYEWTSISKPALTIVKKPSSELGKTAAEILLDKIQNKHPELNNLREVRLLTSILERDSVHTAIEI
jgi:LacI family transcriptional regulator